MTYHYFITYDFVRTGKGYGRGEIETTAPITSISDIEQIEQRLRKECSQNGCGDVPVLVMSYQLMRTTE